MAKRISDISKELGVSSKAIIDKCLLEGVPAEIVKGHMSTVSAGLEASIKEWFSSGGVATAVETTEHLDVDKVKAKSPPRARTKKAKTSEGGAETSNGEASPPATVERVEPKPAPTEEPASKPVVNEEPATAPAAAAPAAPAPAAPTTPAVTTPQPPREPVMPAGLRSTLRPSAPTPPRGPIRPVQVDRPNLGGPVTPPAPAPAGPSQRTGGPGAPGGPNELRPAAHHGPGGQGGPGGSQESGGPGGPSGPGGSGTGRAGGPGGHGGYTGPLGPGAIRGPSRPAQMNVPTRPTVIAPAGPKLVEKQQVKLAGPKVVRVEAPEVIARPRTRRDGPGEGGPRGPGGAGGDDDRRRGGGGAGTTTRRKDAERAGVPARRRGLAEKPGESTGGMWREQDLAEREARLSRATGFLKAKRQALRKQGHGQGGERAQSAAETGGRIAIVAPFTIKDLSGATGVKAADIIKKLFMQGVMATVNSGIDPEKAQEIMMDFDIELEVQSAKTAEEVVSEQFADREQVDVRSRGPIVTILGHVDHGKTSLLDKIRNANVAAGEAGGITQKTSAFRVPVTIGGTEKQILFLDTPGHEAFTSMRARGAQVTDIVVLVVSAPEGVMPQTIESINHAKAAQVPIVVALNKIDRPDATDAKVNQTLGELAAAGLNPVEWGGDVEVIRTSATRGDGIEKLLEVLDLQGELLELKADYGGPARGSVVEARVEEGRGAVADIIVQDGELNVGDFVVAGRAFGRVRDIVDDRSKRHKSIGPATVARISGIDEVPDAGDKFYVVDTLRQAQEAAEQRRERDRDAELSKPKVTLDSLLSQMKESDVKEILVVLKADVQGSVDVIKNEIEKVKTDEVKCRVLHAAVGGITESDALLADASKAVIIGFNVIPSNKARILAEAKGVEIRTYQVIYDITDDMRKAAEGLLEPEMKTQILGHAEVRQVFKVTKVGTIAGCYITDGMVQRDALIRVTRNGIVIENNRVLEQLKRFKDDAKEVKAGMECGMKIVGYDDIKEGDVLECYKTVEVKRTL